MVNDIAPTHPLAHAETAITIERGIYHCDACVHQHGSSPEFPIMHPTSPIGFCGEHPTNSAFTKVGELGVPESTVLEVIEGVQEGNEGVFGDPIDE